ncbi:hypothetical protein BDV93DRAFT_556549 [Ceratobasidium sp. AG-I]|nr:hypothetical protein BDV93DRAFT_556549 [Ceratobasidium sp. AG-I]
MCMFYETYQYFSSADNAIADPGPIATLLEVYSSLWLAKLCNVAALAFFSWDIVLTLNDEIEYVWNSRWNAIRVLYMITRYFTLLSIWWYELDHTWVLVPLLVLYLGVQVISTVLLVQGIYLMGAVENPLPGLLTGCSTPFMPDVRWLGLFLCGIIYETILFVLSIYQGWRSHKNHIHFPLLSYLVKDGAVYFLVAVATILVTLIGTTNRMTLPAATSSGRKVLDGLSSGASAEVIRLCRPSRYGGRRRSSHERIALGFTL